MAMSKEVLCPRCGMLLPIDPVDRTDPSDAVGSVFDAGCTMETIVPATIDDVRLVPMSISTSPSPAGEPVFVAGDSGVGRIAAGRVRRRPSSADGLLPSEPDPILGAFRPATDEARPAWPPPRPAAERRPSSAASTSARLRRSSRPTATAAAPQVIGDEEAEGGVPLGFVLLASYASAITLALIWLFATGRARLAPEAPPTIAADSRPDLGADGSKALPPPEPIADDHLTTLGQTLRVGSLEITPLDLQARQRIRLVHSGGDGRRETKEADAGGRLSCGSDSS